MKINKNLQILLAAGALALAAFILPSSQPEQTPVRSLSSTDSETDLEVKEKIQTVNKVEKATLSYESKPKVVAAIEAPVPYFLNSDNFKTYRKILNKVVRSPAEKSQFRLSLLDSRNLEDASNYLKQPSSKPGKAEKINHLKASGFLIKAITAHPLEYEVTQAVQAMLDVNLSDAKSQMTLESYTLLKENKAELLYHALAVSEQIQQSYSAKADDSESQSLLTKVQNLHASNIVISKKMIGDR